MSKQFEERLDTKTRKEEMLEQGTSIEEMLEQGTSIKELLEHNKEQLWNSLNMMHKTKFYRNMLRNRRNMMT
jgi:hypothetical protein